jgi:hypothetical protein
MAPELIQLATDSTLIKAPLAVGFQNGREGLHHSQDAHHIGLEVRAGAVERLGGLEPAQTRDARVVHDQVHILTCAGGRKYVIRRGDLKLDGNHVGEGHLRGIACSRIDFASTARERFLSEGQTDTAIGPVIRTTASLTFMRRVLFFKRRR